MLSALSSPGTRSIQQFSVVGKQNKRLLLRAVGSPLAQFSGAGNYLENPAIDVWDGDSIRVAANDDWNSDDPILLAGMQQTGAFPLPANSQDAAQIFAFAPGDYTLVTRPSSPEGTGTVLAEVFDLEPSNGQLSRIISRGRVERNDALVCGFVISGNTPALVLVRAVGPKLADFGVGDALADPQLKIIASNGVTIAQNDNWNPSDAALVAAMRRSGGILPRGSEKDAAVLVSLPPGAYVAQVQGAGGVDGAAQIEISQPDLLGAADTVLAVDLFRMEVTHRDGRYYYEPQLRVYGVAPATTAFISQLRFHFVDGGSGHISAWPSVIDVGPGGVADLIPFLYGEPQFSFDSTIDATHMAVTIIFRDRGGAQYSVTALAQVTPKP